MSSTAQRTVQLAVFFIVLTWSMIRPHGYLTWVLESLPAIAALVILAIIYRKFRFTDFNYWMILIHCIILLIGAHYSYARVPLFNYLKEVFEFSRNNYDKVGHLAQGFVPALLIRELLIRRSQLLPGKLIFVLVVASALSISALYELIEWWAAIALGRSSEDFLGTQGYVWDTQSDMFYALIGSILAQLLFGRYLDRKAYEAENKTLNIY